MCERHAFVAGLPGVGHLLQRGVGRGYQRQHRRHGSSGCSCCWATVLDVISAAALDTIFTPVVKTRNEARYFRSWPQVQEAYYGLGWRVLDCGPDTLVYHGGYVNSYRSEIAVNRREKLAVCVLASVPGQFTGRCIRGAFDLYQQQADSIRWWEETQRYPLVRRN